jgi:hypothetical protein
MGKVKPRRHLLDILEMKEKNKAAKSAVWIKKYSKILNDREAFRIIQAARKKK